MRHLLHFGLFALALTGVSQASADDNADSDWKRRRGSKVTVTAQVGPRHTLPVRAKVEHRRAPYDSRWTSHERARAYATARQNLHEQERDLERIVRISERWDRATAHHNPHAQRNVERRLDAWLREEIHESRVQPYNDRYRRRLREIRRELEASNGYFAYGRGDG